MKHSLVGTSICIALFTWLTACGPATPTPVGLGPLDVKPTSTPTSAASVGLGPLGTKPVCTPPDVKVKITTFCANPGAGLGGATVQNPGSGYFITKPDEMHCDWTDTKATCSGPSSSKALFIDCTYCTAPGVPFASGDFKCAKGMIMQNGQCSIDPNGDWITCTYTSHWDNALQACVDNVTGNPIPATDICPPGYPYYTADGYCFAKPYPIVDNCQYYPITLGDCSLNPNKPNLGSGGSKSCPAGTTWNGSCCENGDHRCQ